MHAEGGNMHAECWETYMFDLEFPSFFKTSGPLLGRFGPPWAPVWPETDSARKIMPKSGGRGWLNRSRGECGKDDFVHMWPK